MDETKKKKPDEKPDDLDEKDKNEKPEPKSDEQEKEEPKPEDKPKGDESEKPASDDKQDNEKGEETDKPEPKSDEEKTENPVVPAKDEKDEEILRLKTQIAAMELGVSADCMEDAVAIAESYVKNGKSEDINSALQAVVKKYPDMKADGKEGKSKGGFKIGADKPEQKNADDEKLNNAFGIKKK